MANALNPLSGSAWNWQIGDMNYGGLAEMLAAEQKARDLAASYNGIGDGAPGVGVNPGFADPTYQAMQQYGSTPGATMATQEDGRMWRDAIMGPDGNVLWGGDPYYHSPDNPWKEAVLPLAATWFGAPMLGEAIGATGAVGGAGGGAAGSLADMTLNGLQPFSMADAGLTAAGVTDAGLASLGLDMGTYGSLSAADKALVSSALTGSQGATLGGLGGALGASGGAMSSLIPGISNGTLLNLGGNLLNGWMGSNAAGNAADAQLQASRESNALLKSIYDQNRADLAPWRQAGTDALGKIQSLLADPSSLANQGDYKFGFDQGVNALDRSAASRGSLYSGAQAKALTRFGNDYAGSKLDQSYNRLAGIAGTGQQAVNSTNQAGQNYGNQAANNLTGMGNAQASAYMGKANAWSNALGNGLQSMQDADLMELLKRKWGM